MQSDNWIYLDEREPEEYGEVLVSTVDAVFSANFDHPPGARRHGFYLGDRSDAVEVEGVLAWQPLPPPARKPSQEWLQQRAEGKEADVHLAEWTESRPGGMAIHGDPSIGGIVDQQIADGSWFVVFNADIPPVEGLASRGEAFATWSQVIRDHNLVPSAE